MPCGHTKEISNSEGASELLNTLEERLCREIATKVIEYSISSTKNSFSRCKECMRIPLRRKGTKSFEV
jgi:hypothetical protein